MSTLRATIAAFVHRHIAGEAPVVSPIAPTRLDAGGCWETHFVCTQALATVRQLINQDMLRWLDRQPTYVPPELLNAVDALIPEEIGIVVLTHEQWVKFSHLVVTYEIMQEQLRHVPLLDDSDPLTILTHLASVRSAPRFLKTR